ncbi:helix-turn-helix transcriptional regulator [Saccharopolyspora sp. ASAGF58]|uniref:helix-turn-helix domain-containing protein n=1 Tax=Saccharopolyspora sp. ASAGF58 TaxID=2719023 RepID=UPI00143FC641|nr:helix-turn-helix transcriptional regulator [Saccharopolyspora sp. ASAGF58]QIZ34048.1 helix-turn-helix domain-containing protein [Saccharopolyspora sp. ASAGF58]
MSYGRPTVERRQLGLMLKKLRELKGVSQNDAAREIGRKQTRISRAENGVGSLAREELARLLDFYGISEDERATALALGNQARKRQRGRTYADNLPRSFERLADLQADAEAIGFYETGIVPGLAQSPDYARAVIMAFDGVWWETSVLEVESRLEFRMEQQRRVLEAAVPKDISFVLTETALDQVVGGVSVLRGQLLHLLQLSERPNVAVRVLPSSVPDNPLLGGGLITLDFGTSAPRIVFVPVLYGPSTYHDQEVDTVPMFRAFEAVEKISLAEESSRTLLIDKLKRIGS